MSLANVKRGDRVFVYTSRRWGTDVAGYELVVSAGPKFITTGVNHMARRFRRTDGWVQVECGSPEARAFVSEEAYADDAAHAALAERFRKLVRDEYRLKDRYTAAQIRAVLEILEPQE